MTWRANFYWDSRLAGGRRSFEDDQASILLQKILSGILWVREYCKGAGHLGAGYPLKTSSKADGPRKSTAACRVVQGTVLRRELIL